MSRVTETMAKLNGISVVALLWVNAVIAMFAIVANTGFALVVKFGKTPPEIADHVGDAYVSIVQAVLFLATAIAALVKPSFRGPVLKLHSVLLLAAATLTTYYGLEVAIFGVPRGVNFVWNPVIFAFFVAYPIYLAQRSFARPEAPVNAVAVQAPLWAIGGSIVLSAVVMWRVWNVAT